MMVIKFAYIHRVNIADVSFSDYYAGLTDPAKTKYHAEKVFTCGFHSYKFKNRKIQLVERVQ